MLQLRSVKGKIDLPETFSEMEKSNLEDEVVLCAGLQYEGTRPLSADERGALRHRQRSQRRILILWLFGIPVSVAVPFILWNLLNAAFTESPATEDIVLIVAIFSIVIGIPISIYFADIALKRYRVLKRTLSENHARRFKGKLNDEDWTNRNTEFVLRRAAGFEDPDDRELSIDLHAVDDVLFKINDSETDRWIALELTRGIRPPDAPARFKAPIQWVDPEREDDILRRRLTTGELDEILGYANQLRRRRWWQTFLIAWAVAGFSRVVAIKIFELELPAIFLLCTGAIVAICGSVFYYWTSKAERYDQDREDGWAIILEPAQVSTLGDGESVPRQSIEVLPKSGAAWTIGGNPAGWRSRI